MEVLLRNVRQQRQLVDGGLFSPWTGVRCAVLPVDGLRFVLPVDRSAACSPGGQESMADGIMFLLYGRWGRADHHNRCWGADLVHTRCKFFGSVGSL